MTTEIVKGSSDFTLVGQQKKWSREKGWYVEKRYEGPQATHETFANTLILNGADDFAIGTGVPCVISANFPLSPSGYNEDQKAQAEALWELIGETVEKRLETHGHFLVSTASAAVLEKIDQAIKDGTASDTDWDTLYPGLGQFNNYRDLRLMGTDTYDAYTWRVRRTMTVSRQSLLRASFANVGKVIAWSAIQVPTSAKFTQPTIHMVLPLTGSVAGYTDVAVNEWLVQPPSVRWRKGIRKWEITNEWLGAEKTSSTLYDGGTATP